MAPIGLQHVNLSVAAGTLHLAQEFYGTVLGLANDTVPHLQKDVLLWFRLGAGPQQIHISFERNPLPSVHKSSRHPCFALPTGQALLDLQRRIYEHHAAGGEAAALECDKPGTANSGSKGVEYPDRFFARDYAGNRLEFAVHSM
ncbi:hypothetical protein CcaverHIS002_0200430 [Cutaneotrichosporon cavernicola]|uniref:VOC domain-containing protein n=1 Tax=Cutaneotrichosporon cavernicola TaxID=279322 RepID=A0AA48L0U6_9TREE|nr:uncharacterized protein CcaverHIS019_0200470 [Cutaneotrichosporon cavernicola]BEI80883.1 hypothetical protein CcaverHIS002_0200430 [Cutaneotrichosporon cavernicola]BEI88685.1 hypothetical protein CcaverHIS019_0200470 [Cutaneotrichosporon cavernicola]BEI96459.1 hypothetical protein CcaverHIS631_0200480 [Cutaneotrichosporon cavernicola]